MDVRLLSILAFLAGCLLSPLNAAAVDLWRNHQRYDLNIRITNGGQFTKQGIDRIFMIDGGRADMNIYGSLRLIQDELKECGSLITSRKQNQAHRGYTEVYESVTTRGQCVISLGNKSSGTMMTSYYLWLDMCSCYAALHFRYTNTASLFFEAAGRNVIDDLVNAAKKGKIKGSDPFSVIDADWKEGIRILHDRGFSPLMAEVIQTNFFGYSYISGITDARRPGELGIDYIGKLWGARKSGGRWSFMKSNAILHPDIGFDVENGFAFWDKSVKPQTMARAISDCYKTIDYMRRCKLNYHSQMGCMMTRQWQRFCRKTVTDKAFAEYGDLCYYTPKGDLPMAPVAKVSEKTVMLPSSRKAKGKAKMVKMRKAPACDNSLLKDYAGKY